MGTPVARAGVTTTMESQVVKAAAAASQDPSDRIMTVENLDQSLDHLNLDHLNLDHLNLEHLNLDHLNLDHLNLDRSLVAKAVKDGEGFNQIPQARRRIVKSLAPKAYRKIAPGVHQSRTRWMI